MQSALFGAPGHRSHTALPEKEKREREEKERERVEGKEECMRGYEVWR